MRIYYVHCLRVSDRSPTTMMRTLWYRVTYTYTHSQAAKQASRSMDIIYGQFSIDVGSVCSTAAAVGQVDGIFSRRPNVECLPMSIQTLVLRRRRRNRCSDSNSHTHTRTHSNVCIALCCMCMNRRFMNTYCYASHRYAHRHPPESCRRCMQIRNNIYTSVHNQHRQFSIASDWDHIRRARHLYCAQQMDNPCWMRSMLISIGSKQYAMLNSSVLASIRLFRTLNMYSNFHECRTMDAQ